MRAKLSKFILEARKKSLFIIIFSGILLLSILLIFSLFRILTATGGIALIVDNKKYSKTNVEKYIKYGEDTGLDREQAINAVVENLKFLAAADKLATKYDQNKVDNRYNELKKTYKKSDYGDYLNKLAQKQIIAEDLQQGDIQKGYYFEFYYGQHIQTGPGNKIAGVGDKNLIEKDRQYAKARADYYYNILKNQKVSASDTYAMVQQEVQKDPTNAGVHISTKPFGNNSSEEWQDEIQNSETISTVYSTSGVSDIKTRKGAVNIGPSSLMTDVAYYIIAKTSGNNNAEITRFKKTIDNLKVERRI
ncbi:hypothetical protein A3F37_03745 [Candidatus Saccharibacteria bacterium RIFCSPHIGHO2_12_FULL_41_12]|nr:MAG: hypothetical protein A3F37_03745 [Candidatus Saccharibacteria bacterium RIFCSPHIGHO2_12_FULL_41_12]